MTRRGARERGQATTEYILLLSIVVGAFILAQAQFRQLNLTDKFTQMLTQQFTSTYQYGKPGAKGYDDGGPLDHPRAQDADGDVRIFYVKNQQ